MVIMGTLIGWACLNETAVHVILYKQSCEDVFSRKLVIDNETV